MERRKTGAGRILPMDNRGFEQKAPPAKKTKTRRNASTFLSGILVREVPAARGSFCSARSRPEKDQRNPSYR